VKFETLTAVTHLLITKFILKLAGICGFCNVIICTFHQNNLSDIKPLNWTTKTRTTVVCVPRFPNTLRRPQLCYLVTSELPSADHSAQ
jgi:hypothetical protein